MAISRVHTWSAGEVLLASDLNAEFNSILNNGSDLVSPFTKAVSMGGFALNFDAANTIALTATTSGVILTGGTLREPAEDSITAFATGGQTNATALSIAKKYHRISTCATAADSVKLPSSTSGQAHFIRNDGAAAMQVFGTSPDTINGVATGTGVPLPAGIGSWYVCTTAGNWISGQSPVSVSGNFAVTFTATATTAVTLPTSGTLAILGANTFTGAQTTNATSGFNESKTTVASATTPDIWTSTGNVIDYTGTVTATGFAAAPQAGVRRTLVCAGAAVFTAGANMLIQGVASAANYTATAGDVIAVIAITTTQFRLFINPVTGIPGKQPTRQKFTSGSGTYTTPSGATRINVRLIGGGAGATGNAAAAATAGGDTTFSTLTGGGGVAGGSGSTGGTATGGDINIPGGAGGGIGQTATANTFLQGGHGGNGAFGGGGAQGPGNSNGGTAATNSGAGGGGGGGASGGNSGAGGGSGGYVEKLITAPSATYSYGVGAGGAGTAGTASTGGTGAAGIIIVDEWYD